MKILDRQGTYSPVCLFFFTASTCTQVKMSNSPTDSFKYFLSLSWSSYCCSCSSSESFSWSSSYSSSGGAAKTSKSGGLSTLAMSPEAIKSWKTLVSLVAVMQISLTLFQSVGMSLLVVSLARNKSRQLSWLASFTFLQLEIAMMLPAFSISMFQGQVPPLTVRRVRRNSGQHRTACRWQLGSSLQQLPMVMSPSSSVLTGLISQTWFSLNRRGVQDTRSTQWLIQRTFPVVLSSCLWQWVALGRFSRMFLVMFLISCQSFLTVIFLKLVFIWLTQGRKNLCAFLVYCLRKGLPSFLLSKMLASFEMCCLSLILILFSTTMNSAYSCLPSSRAFNCANLMFLQKWQRFEKDRGMCLLSGTCQLTQSSFTLISKSSSTLKSIVRSSSWDSILLKQSIVCVRID